MIIRTLVYTKDGELIGYQLNDDDYIHLGGAALANAFSNYNAFRDHFVHLVRTQSGQIEIVSDTRDTDSFPCVAGVGIDEHPSGWWTLSSDQHAEVRDELATAQGKPSAERMEARQASNAITEAETLRKTKIKQLIEDLTTAKDLVSELHDAIINKACLDAHATATALGAALRELHEHIYQEDFMVIEHYQKGAA